MVFVVVGAVVNLVLFVRGVVGRSDSRCTIGVSWESEGATIVLASVGQFA
jgi:hypothetical protein